MLVRFPHNLLPLSFANMWQSNRNRHPERELRNAANIIATSSHCGYGTGTYQIRLFSPLLEKVYSNLQITEIHSSRSRIKIVKLKS
jgi:hypothetical protein